ncbi:unnamed protein product, partial [Rotaria magnacalcarata]
LMCGCGLLVDSNEEIKW